MMTSRHKNFAEAYVANGRNATQAYKSISPKSTDKTAAQEGMVYLRKPGIVEYIKELESELSTELKITRESILADFQDIKDRNLDGNDKVAIQALQEQIKMLGFYAPDKNLNLNLDEKVKLTNEHKRALQSAFGESGSKEGSSGN